MLKLPNCVPRWFTCVTNFIQTHSCLCHVQKVTKTLQNWCILHFFQLAFCQISIHWCFANHLTAYHAVSSFYANVLRYQRKKMLKQLLKTPKIRKNWLLTTSKNFAKICLATLNYTSGKMPTKGPSKWYHL